MVGHPHRGGHRAAAAAAVAALGVVEASAWGDGAHVVVDRVPQLLGEDQDDSGFAPHPDHPVLVAAHRRHRGVRVPRTLAVFEALAAAAIEQVVTGLEAHRAWRDLLLRFGDAAPGAPRPPRQPRRRDARAAERPRLGGHPQLGVAPGGRRGATTPRGAPRRPVRPALERTTALPLERVEPALRSLPGVGVWTAAEVRHRAHATPTPSPSPTTTWPRTSPSR